MNNILELLEQYTLDNPNAAVLFDEAHSKGITYRQMDDLTGRVYAWLKNNGVGREDFVLIILFEPFSFSPSVGQMRPLAWGHCCSFWPRRTQEKMIL